jgi:hypothetical protein
MFKITERIKSAARWQFGRCSGVHAALRSVSPCFTNLNNLRPSAESADKVGCRYIPPQKVRAILKNKKSPRVAGF